MKIRNLVKCNECDVDNCKLINTIMDSSKCTSFEEPSLFKMPIVTHLLSDISKVEYTYRVLKAFNLIVKEIDKYPYLILKVKKK